MKRLLSFAAVVPFVFCGLALHAQKTGGDVAAQDAARWGVQMTAGPAATTVDGTEGTELAQGFNASNGPLDFAEKAHYFARHTFSAGAFAAPFLWSVPILAKPPAHYPKEWRQGAGALGRLYGDALAFQTAAQTGKFLAEASLHEDPRYSASSSRAAFARAIHAIAFTAFDRSDSGRRTFAVSNFVASAAAGFEGNAYLPNGYNDMSHAVNRMGIEFGSLVITNLAEEFTPEFRRFGKRMHLPAFMLPSDSRK